ncbi:MAG TPA: tetratricopeptide repeat protein, partial [Terriglobales bacterium]|nr:tetratricopeptide repeat protein [Terriglobales bacterium]
PVRDIARELAVDGVLEGSVSRTARGVHMTVQLIYAPTDTHIWAESYDRDAGEAFALPVELSQTIAKRLKVSVSPVSAQRPLNPEAHDLYLRGRYLWFTSGPEQSRKYFEKAIELQPDYAAAWSGLADSYAVAAWDGSPPREAMERAESAGRKALELDDSLPEAHNTMAAVYFAGKWDWANADAESRRALDLNPNYAEARHLHAYILMAMGRPEEALQEQKRSTELEPFARPWALGYVLIRLRRFDEAISELRLRAQAERGDSTVHFMLSDAYWFKGMWKESAEETEQACLLKGDQKCVSGIKHAFESRGKQGVAEWLLRDTKAQSRKGHISPWLLAGAYAQAGRKEEALRSLEAAYRERSPKLVFLQNAPNFDSLHSDPRYQAIVKKMGLPPLQNGKVSAN